MSKRRRQGRKAKRRRQARRPAGVTEDLLNELLGVENLPALQALLRGRPELSGPRVARDLDEMAAAPGYGASFRRLASLLRGVRTDPQGAWTRYQAARDRAERLGQDLEQDDEAIEAAFERREFDRVIQLIDAAVPKAEDAGLGMGLAHLYSLKGLALLNRPSVDRASDLEASIEAHEAALDLAGSPEQTADLLMHLGLVYSERIAGDRGENLDRAVFLLRAALKERADSANHPELEAMTRTNLAMALLKSERGDEVARLNEAAELCEAALSYRSPERDAVDWAYTQLNLGDILEHLARVGERDLADARQAYQRIIEEAEGIDQAWLVGGAHHALGRSYLAEAQVDADDVLEAAEAGDLDAAFENTDLLEKALHHLELARELSRTGPDPIRRAYVLDHLSEVLADLERGDEAIPVAREALNVLRPTTAPRDCLRVAGRLGSLLAERDEWPAAADAFQDAVAAAEITFHGRLETAGREEEMRRSSHLSRWASYAAARSGDPVQAALILENGRARELRRRLDLPAEEAERFGELPDELKQTFLRAADAVTTGPMGALGADAARRLQEALTAIRGIAGFADFMTGARAGDLRSALEERWPLVYVNPTPSGTLLLRLSTTKEGELSVTPRFLDVPRAIDVFMRLMAGDAADLEDPDEAADSSSYLFGITGHSSDSRDFRADLDSVLPWLGSSLGVPLSEMLVDAEAIGVTLVLCGPISLAPLHAASWQTPSGYTCLLDSFEVRYAPSAALGGAALNRARTRERNPAHFVGLADPEGDLPAARAEVAEIAPLFGQDAECASGPAASRAFLEENASDATHLHLACHASGDLFGVYGTQVRLADGPVSVFELTALAGLQARVVAVSACQTGLSEIADLPDEAFSIGTAMLGAGSASAFASLWPVDDLSTAVLMTRTYEEMLRGARRPPEALRRAQLWLRTLSADGESEFLDAHPALRAEYRRRATRKDLPGRRGCGSSGLSLRGPYAHPEHWAGFVAVGA